MSDTSKKIIQEIRERGITHRPRWYFMFRNVAVWTSLGAATLFGAFAVSVERSAYRNGFATGNFFDLVSWLWILFTLLFVILAFFNLRLTNEGYRHGASWAIIAILLVIALFAVLFCWEGVGDNAEGYLEHTSFYRNAPFHLDPDRILRSHLIR